MEFTWELMATGMWWRSHPVILAMIVRHVLTGSAEGGPGPEPRAGYRTARTELCEAVPPHMVDVVLTAYRDLGRQLVTDARSAELVERALCGEAL